VNIKRGLCLLGWFAAAATWILLIVGIIAYAIDRVQPVFFVRLDAWFILAVGVPLGAIAAFLERNER